MNPTDESAASAADTDTSAILDTATDDSTELTDAEATTQTTDTTVAVKVSAPKTAIRTIKTTKTRITLRWTAKAAATGYQIQIATKKSMKNASIKTIKNNTTHAVTIKNRKPGKTYYLRVRTYRVVNGKTYYGKWTTIQKATMKK